MATEFVSSIVTHEDSYEAGRKVAQQAKEKLKDSSLKIQLAVLFCAIRYEYEAVMRGISSVVGEEVQLIGCTATGQFTDNGVMKDGVACAFIASDSHQFFTGLGTNLKSDMTGAVERATEEFPFEVEGYPYQTAIILVDGLAGKGEEAVLAALSKLGPLVRFAGGAAADDLSFKETFVFYKGKAFNDALTLCLTSSRSPVIIGCQHAHRPLSPPLHITKAKDNILYEVDGRPPLDVWKDYLRDKLKAEEGIDIDQLNLSEMSKILLKYEAGLMTGNEYKIRFPASCNPDGSFNFVCSLLEGSVIKIMDSQDEEQIASARHAVELALQSKRKNVTLAGAIIFDCACRAMILEDQFPKAIEGMQQVLGSIPFIGCETYGEIAMDMGQLSGFHNTTTVIMLFPA